MKKNTTFRLPLLVVVCGILILQSCEKRCNCSANYESTRKYFKGDLVTYDGKCWKAVNEGHLDHGCKAVMMSGKSVLKIKAVFHKTCIVQSIPRTKQSINRIPRLQRGLIMCD